MPDTLQKLDYLTMHLRGFDRRGAAAALHSASATGFTLSGVWKDSADFAVLVLYDADEPFGHPRWRYLPDFDFTGLTLKFDVAYTNLFPLDSPFFVDFTKADLLQVIKQDGSTATVKLFDHAKKVGGTLSVASGTFTFEDNGIQAFDRVTPWVEEYLIARLREQLPHVNWWAWDRLELLRWAAMPLPSQRAWAWRRRLARTA